MLKKRTGIVLALNLLWLLSNSEVFAQKNQGTTQPAISVLIKPLAKQKIYLGSYYGKYQTLVDSIFLTEQGSGIFKSTVKYTPGVYFLVSKERSLLFEFLMDDQQNFSIQADSLKGVPKFSGSEENNYYSAYNQFLAQKVPVITQLKEQLSKAQSRSDSTKLSNQIQQSTAEIETYRQEFKKQHPGSLLSFLFQASKLPQLPDSLLVKAKTDPQIAKQYYQKHYWQGISFADTRLIRTPFFDKKLEDYLKFYISPEPDSLIKEVGRIINESRSKPGDQFKYLLTRLTDKYINPEIMGQDKVFMFLFNQYYDKESYSWLSEKTKKYIYDRAYSLMANQIGSPAPPLNLLGLNQQAQSLYQQKAKFTIIAFWDPNCSHCKKEIPRLDSAYRASLKIKGVRIFAVNVDEMAQKAWTDFITKYQLTDWIHAYQPEEEKLMQQKQQIPNYRQLYDISSTPVFYLLDENKTIIGKKLAIEQIGQMIDLLLEKKPVK